MALNSSPRKVVPLSKGDDWAIRPRSNSVTRAISATKRAFFCGVVVEGPSDGRAISEDVQELVASLGDNISLDVSRGDAVVDPNPGVIEPSLYAAKNDGPQTRKRALTDSTALADLIDELVATERSYVARLRTLKESYADPLRSYARSKDTAIIPPYEAKILFGNVDNLLPVNEAFLQDLETMMTPNGERTVGGVGDVVLRHFKDLRAFDCYKQYYIKREEAQAIFKREVTKKSSAGFAAFVERIKYSTSDSKNRIGLRELLMDPVQRIPRYTLMFRSMVKHMHANHPQRAKLIEADEIASKIALAETDDHTKRAAIMYCLAASIDGFPPGLISNSRRFIDCIDVEDNLAEGLSSSSASSSASVNTATSAPGSLHCTLFLFDDKLMIVKRPNGEKSGRLLAGLDDLEKFTNGGGFPRGTLKKNGMSCKGVVDVIDVVATDVSGPDIHIYFETPPKDQSERWSNRPFRVLSVALPPSPINQDPIQTENDKRQFLEHLWSVQARYRTKMGQSVVLYTEDKEVESRAGRVTLARTYFNIYQRTSFLKEHKKTKVVLHIDPSGFADPIPFGLNSPPFVVVRVQPMAGELCRYTVTSSDPDDDAEEDILQTARVPSRIIHTIHQYGLFKFRTGYQSRPTTPTASTRSRAHIFGLDVISRNLFSAKYGTSKGDPFGGGSVNSHRRSKSSVSRSSAQTETTMITASDSLMKYSHRSNSTTATSFMDEDSFIGRSVSKSRKLVKRGKSPGVGSGSESERASPRRGRSRSASRERSIEYSDEDDETRVDAQHFGVNQSEMDLTMRLELARRNSRNQHCKKLGLCPTDKPVEEIIYEEEPPVPMRPASRAAHSRSEKDTAGFGPTTPSRTRSTTPIPASESPHKGRSTSQHSPERRPLGPRSPSPLPPSSSELPPMDLEYALETTLINMGHTPQTPSYRLANKELVSPLPRSKRQPFEPTGNADVTPRIVNGTSQGGGAVEPLSIKKKTSTNSKPHIVTRKEYSKDSPLAQPSSKILRRLPSQNTEESANMLDPNAKGVNHEKLLQLAATTREDLVSSRRAIKKIKLEVSSLSSQACRENDNANVRLRSPGRPLTRISQRDAANATREASQRMDEMRQIIGQRNMDGTPRSRPRSIVSTVTPMDNLPFCQCTKNIDDLVTVAGHDIARAADNYELLQTELNLLVTGIKEDSLNLEKVRSDLRSTKRQCELVKNLLADATAENEIMYEAFNEELDGMFNDANLPEEEAWAAMTHDLQQTKEARNKLTKENAQLKRRLQEVEMQRDEWAALLREHGLIS